MGEILPQIQGNTDSTQTLSSSLARNSTNAAWTSWSTVRPIVLKARFEDPFSISKIENRKGKKKGLWFANTRLCSCLLFWRYDGKGGLGLGEKKTMMGGGKKNRMTREKNGRDKTETGRDVVKLRESLSRRRNFHPALPLVLLFCHALTTRPGVQRIIPRL